MSKEAFRKLKKGDRLTTYDGIFEVVGDYNEYRDDVGLAEVLFIYDENDNETGEETLGAPNYHTKLSDIDLVR